MTNASKFLSIKTREELADYLSIPLKELTFFAYSKSIFYKKAYIPKRSGRLRTLSIPIGKLKKIQHAIAEVLDDIYDPPDCVHGFVSAKSTVTNAARHTKKQFVIKIDLVDFFPTIRAGRIHGLFKNKPFSFPRDVVNALTNLTTTEDQLPQGSPCSPVLSNMICFRMDCALLEYARKHNVKYTRYADDLTFSSTKRGALSYIAKVNDVGKTTVHKDIRKIILRNGFNINESKTKVMRSGSRQTVTGIVVNKKCNFRRSDYRFLRGLFHHWDKQGIEVAAKLYTEANWASHYRQRFYNKDELDRKKFVDHIYGLLCYYLMIIRRNNRPSTSLQKLWTSFFDLTGIKTPMLMPQRYVMRTDSYYNFHLPGKNEGIEGGSLGSAFLLDTGLMITARHCCKEQKPEYWRAIYDDDCCLLVEWNDGGQRRESEIEYQSIKDSPLYDVAWFKTPDISDQLAGLRPAKGHSLQEGEIVTAYGYADGKNQLRKIEARVTSIYEEEVIVSRAFIKGMSGGPVLNVRGEVVGVITQGSGDGIYDKDGRFAPIKLIEGLN